MRRSIRFKSRPLILISIFGKIAFAVSIGIKKFYYYLIYSRVVYSLKDFGGDVYIDFDVLIGSPHCFTMGSDIFIGRGCHFNCIGGLTIGSGTIVSPNVRIFTYSHDLKAKESRRGKTKKLRSVLIGENVWIGANTVILAGYKIGNNAVVGAGSVVNRDVLENEIFINGR